MNRLFLCSVKEPGQAVEAQTFEIIRDDTIPHITFEPRPGEFGAMPEIRLSVAGGADVAYGISGEDPTFDNDGKTVAGQKYTAAIKTESSSVKIKARAVSASGVQSAVFCAEYRENRRLRGWNSLDIYAGGLYLATLGAVKDYLPNGIGGVLGVRYGLDSFLAPSQNDIQARPFWLPGAWAELHYLSFSNSPYSETAAAMIAGAEWQLPLTAAYC